jgi:Uma2 family endonuclease
MGVIDELPADLGVVRHRLTVEQYHRMVETGVLAPDSRVELIEGVIVEMPPIGSLHAGTVNRLTHALTRAVGSRAIVAVQNSVRLGDWSEPQPDFALLRPRDDFYTAKTPEPGDVLLIIEVAHTSSVYDRRIKVPLYAQHRIPELWIIDLDAALLRCWSAPRGDGYERAAEVATPGPMSVQALPGVVVDLTGVL